MGWTWPSLARDWPARRRSSSSSSVAARSSAVMAAFSFMHEDFNASIRLAIGCLTNSGAVIGDYAKVMTPAGDVLAIFSMILGRLEILALIPALSVSFWRG